MPLTESEKILLHEIYETVYPGTEGVVVSAGTGVAVSPFYTTSVTSIQTRLQTAIAFIDSSDDRVNRVVEILAEYQNFALDPSNIAREGYSFRAGKSLRNLRQKLYSLTGILVGSDFGGNGNMMCRG